MPSRRQQIFIAVGMVALSFNLRPAAVSVGPVLDNIRAGLGMSSTTAGVVTTLPVLCFALFGGLAPWFARLLGAHRVMLASLLVTVAGLAIRSEAQTSVVFIAATVPALAGMATANVLLPSLVKRHFPERIGLMTSVYTTALACGLTAGSALTVPIADAAGSWRGGLAAWAIVAVLAAIPWVALIRHDIRPAVSRPGSIPFRDVARSPLAWALALFFGIQSIQAYSVFGWLPQVYQDAGYSASSAGLLLGLATSMSIPTSLALPGIVVRRTNQAPLILGLCGCFVFGYIGLILAPTHLPWLWALSIGVGTGIFPLVLTLIGLRSRTSDGTAALSGFTQSVGYLLSAAGPIMMGVVYGVTGGWTVPLSILTILVVPQAIAGLMVSRPRYLEDELPQNSPAPGQAKTPTP